MSILYVLSLMLTSGYCDKCMSEKSAVYYQENCYRLVQKWYNYTAAIDYCTSIGNTLAVVQSADHAFHLIESFRSVWQVQPMWYNFWVSSTKNSTGTTESKTVDGESGDKKSNKLAVYWIVTNVGCPGLQWSETNASTFFIADTMPCSSPCCWFFCEEKSIFQNAACKTRFLWVQTLLVLFLAKVITL